MISICCGCDKVYAWGAACIGVFAGPWMMFCSWTVAKLEIDDPLDAFAVHAGGGSVGLVLTPFFWAEHGLFYGNKPDEDGNTAAMMLGKCRCLRTEQRRRLCSLGIVLKIIRFFINLSIPVW